MDECESTKERIKQRLYHKFLLNMKITGFQTQVLISNHDYVNASEEFSNCVKTYVDEASNVFVVYDKSTPIACVEVRNNKIVQISGQRNISLPSSMINLIENEFKRAKAARIS